MDPQRVADQHPCQSMLLSPGRSLLLHGLLLHGLLLHGLLLHGRGWLNWRSLLLERIGSPACKVLLLLSSARSLRSLRSRKLS